MTTLTRWWAPVGPHVGPDAVEELMLKGGGDVAKDIGQVLLALHRVGGAACEKVARTPLADEQDLILTLAAARARSAPTAVDTISKGLGPQADPWLKDVLDDAERAALSLYRACIAKRVPHPLAAQRVGMVYGVPEAYLGSFQRLATVTATPPSVLTDAADRTLFEFVAKAGDQDVRQEKETFSKAPAQERPRQRETSSLQALFDQADRDYHGKDEGERSDETGQFIRVGTKPAETIPPVVGTPGKVAPTPSQLQAQRLARLKRVERVERVNRAMAAQARAKMGQAMSPSMQAKMTPQMKASMKAKMAQREMRAQMASKINGKAFNDAAEGKNHHVTPLLPGEIPDLLASQDQELIAAPLDQQVAFLLLSDEFPALIGAMGDGEERKKVFRAGGMQDYTRQVHRHIDMDTDQEHPEMADAALGLAERVRKDRHIKKPVVEDVEKLSAYVEGRFAPQDEREMTRLKLEFLKERQQAGDLPSWATPVGELDHTDIVMSKDSFAGIDAAEKWVLVWHEPVWDNPVADRGRVNLTELVLPGDKIKGIDDGSGRNATEITLDPNQGWGIRMGAKKTTVFDEQAKAYRTKVVAVPVWEDEIEEAWERRGGDQWNGGKAMDGERFRQLERQGRIVRDKDGQFTDLQGLFDQAEQTYAEEAEQVQAPAKANPRDARLARLKRVERVQRAQPRPGASMQPAMASRMGATMGATMTPAMKAQMRLKVQAALEQAVQGKHADPDAEMGVFIPGFDYSVVTREDMALALINPDGSSLVREYFGDAVDDVQAELRASMDDEHEDQMLAAGRKRPDDTTKGKHVIYAQLDDYGLSVLRRRVHDLFQDPKVTHIQLSTKRSLSSGAKEPTLEVQIEVNAGPTNDITAVRWEDMYGHRGPVDIHKGRNARALSTGTIDTWMDGWYAAAGSHPAHTLWLNNPHVQEYVVQPRSKP